MVAETFTAANALRCHGMDARADLREAGHQRPRDDALLPDRRADHAALPGGTAAQPVPVPRREVLLPAQSRTSADGKGIRQAFPLRTDCAEERPHRAIFV